MKRLGLIALLIPILIIMMSFVDTTDGSMTPDGEIGVSCVILVNSIAKDITIQDLLNVEFEATNRTEAEYFTTYINNDKATNGICLIPRPNGLYDRGVFFADVEYIYIGDILPSDGLRLSKFL